MLIHCFHYSHSPLRVTQYDMQRLSKLDGLGAWREQEAADLSNLVQKRLHALQNPPDCSMAKKLICNLNKVVQGGGLCMTDEATVVCI